MVGRLKGKVDNRGSHNPGEGRAQGQADYNGRKNYLTGEGRQQRKEDCKGIQTT